MEAIETILLIDDEEVNHFLTTQLLKRNKITQQVLLSAHNGLEGLATLKELTDTHKKLPKIILLDLKMPIMNGFEFLEALMQQNLNLNQSKIYVLSSSLHPQDRQKAASFPIAGYLNKPLTAEKLAPLLQ